MHSRVPTVAILAFCVLSCAIAEDDTRSRTTRRELDLDEEETSFIASVEGFLNEAEGTTSKEYWPEGADPLQHFGIMQEVMINDMLLQLCIMSGSYTRKKPPPLPSQNPPTPPPEGSPVKRDSRYRRVFEDLYRLLTERTVNTTTPPIEDWENDPYDVLEEAEYQFTNLCFTLFELRRLNRKLVRQSVTTTTPTTTPPPP